MENSINQWQSNFFLLKILKNLVLCMLPVITEVMMGNEKDEIIKEPFEKISRRTRKEMKGSEFVFDSVDLLHYKLRRLSLNRGGSYYRFS